MKETKAREEVGKKLVDVTEALKKALGAWRETERVGLIKPYERFFDAETRRLKENVKRDKVTEMFAARFVGFCLVPVLLHRIDLYNYFMSTGPSSSALSSPTLWMRLQNAYCISLISSSISMRRGQDPVYGCLVVLGSSGGRL